MNELDCVIFVCCTKKLRDILRTCINVLGENNVYQRTHSLKSGACDTLFLCLHKVSPSGPLQPVTGSGLHFRHDKAGECNE